MIYMYTASKHFLQPTIFPWNIFKVEWPGHFAIFIQIKCVLKMETLPVLNISISSTFSSKLNLQEMSKRTKGKTGEVWNLNHRPTDHNQILSLTELPGKISQTMVLNCLFQKEVHYISNRNVSYTTLKKQQFEVAIYMLFWSVVISKNKVLNFSSGYLSLLHLLSCCMCIKLW